MCKIKTISNKMAKLDVQFIKESIGISVRFKSWIVKIFTTAKTEMNVWQCIQLKLIWGH